MSKLKVSNLKKTWLFDFDGTIVKHNSSAPNYELIEGAIDFIKYRKNLGDTIVLLTARKYQEKAEMELFFAEHGVFWDMVLTDLPHGERILLNDNKESGLKTAVAINFPRNECNYNKIELEEIL